MLWAFAFGLRLRASLVPLHEIYIGRVHRILVCKTLHTMFKTQAEVWGTHGGTHDVESRGGYYLSSETSEAAYNHSGMGLIRSYSSVGTGTGCGVTR